MSGAPSARERELAVLDRVEWPALDADARRAILRRPVQAVADDVRVSVQRIVALVRRDGDAALRTLSARYDGAPLQDFAVAADEFERQLLVEPLQILDLYLSTTTSLTPSG